MKIARASFLFENPWRQEISAEVTGTGDIYSYHKPLFMSRIFI